MRHDQYPTAHAPAPKPQNACPSHVTASRMRHDQHPSAHARVSARNCACPGFCTILRMLKRWHRTTHAPRSAPNCACPSVEAALRMPERQTHSAAILPIRHQGAPDTAETASTTRSTPRRAASSYSLSSLFVVRAEEKRS